MDNPIESKFLSKILLSRENLSHKGDYGHLLVVSGCTSMPGAASLCCGAALRSGCGLVTLHTTKSVSTAVAIAHPSAMLSLCEGDVISAIPDLSRYSAVAVGPGMGRDPSTIRAVSDLVGECSRRGLPMLLDADALFALSKNTTLLDMIPKGSVMTPHEGELARLVSWTDAESKDSAVRSLSSRTGCVIVSKGYHTRVYSPDGTVMTNTTGNPGMAKGGSGDVLTGLVSGLMARGYPAFYAACLGVWIHGYAGDVLSEERTQEAWCSEDLIHHLYLGFRQLYCTE